MNIHEMILDHEKRINMLERKFSRYEGEILILLSLTTGILIKLLFLPH